MATASVPNAFTNATPADASEVNANFTSLVSFLNNSTVHVDGSKAMTAAFDAGTYKILRVGTGVAATDAVNKGQMDTAVAAVASDVSDLTAYTLGAPPVGAGMEWFTDVAPPLWLLQDGAAVSRTTYSALFAKIGTTFGDGDGSTTFNLPDRRNRFAIGKGDNTGNDTLGETGGQRNAVVVEHDHDNDHNHAPFTTATGGEHQHTVRFLDTGSSGGSNSYARPDGFSFDTNRFLNTPNGGHTHNIDVPAYTGKTSEDGVAGTDKNLPPYVTINYIIFAGV